MLSAVFANSSPELVEQLVEAGANLSVTAAYEAGCAGRGQPRDVQAWAVHLGRTALLPLLAPATP